MLRKCGVLALDKRGRFWMYRTRPEALLRAAAAIDAIVPEAAQSQPR